MKRLITVILLFIFTLCLTNCKKDQNDAGEVDKHYSGFYIEIKEDLTYKIDHGINPRIYFTRKNGWKISTGNVGLIEFGDIVHINEVRDGIDTVILSLPVTLPNTVSDKIKIYMIREDLNGNVSVDLKDYTIIDLTKKDSHSVNISYSINKVEYRFQGTLKLNKLS